MRELGVFLIFLGTDLSKFDKILGLVFLKARKDFRGFKTAVFHGISIKQKNQVKFTTTVYSSRGGRVCELSVS